jgi:anthranilate synthase/aminodeoxychorismate synthase-like glutamine amidotransferase
MPVPLPRPEPFPVVCQKKVKSVPELAINIAPRPPGCQVVFQVLVTAIAASCALHSGPLSLAMRVLFLENHDSFSWNVIDALPVGREEVTIVSGNPKRTETLRQAQGDDVQRERSQSGNPPQAVGHQTPQAVGHRTPQAESNQIALSDYDCLVIGPGPTDPIRAGLIQVVNEAARLRLPTLGICLGHQAIGLAFGAKLVRTEPWHGKRSQITFRNSRLFAGMIGPHTVMRYHSLSLAQVASPLRVIATTDNGIPMAVEHESLPIAGLQFHPDSYATERGREMIAAFFETLG